MPGRRCGGAVSIAVALSTVVLVGLAGVVVDLGRLFVMKTELQNAADACALAAAQELDGNAGALTRAENAGISVGTRNAVNFQSHSIAVGASDISFALALSSGAGDNSNYATQAAGAPANARYARCLLQMGGVAMSLASILGVGAQSVATQAVATLAPAQSACAVPLGMCAAGAAPSFGMVPGQWYSGFFGAGGGVTGNFNWLDFSPPGGGASELAALLTGPGVCNTAVNSPVGQTGALGNAAARAWNSRFGLYQGGGGNPSLATAPPDFTGFAYTPLAWPSQQNALADFLSPQRVAHSAYQGNAATGLDLNPSYTISTPAQLAAGGASRRLVVAPLVDCAGWAGAQTVPILSYGCVLMLHPIGAVSDLVRMEYVGLASDPASPCATSGLAGGSFGPLVPVLVQ
jgi:hypothetical protein